MPKNIYDNRGRKIGEIRDPGEEAAAAVLLIYLIWKALPAIILIAVVIGIGSFLWQAGTNLARYGTIDEQAGIARVSATQAAIQRATAEVVAGRIQEGLSYLRQYRGTIAINRVVTKGREFVRIQSVEFAPDGIRVYFNAETSEGMWYHKPGWSCIIWQGRNLVEGAESWDDYNSPITEGLYIRPIAEHFSSENLDPNFIESGATVFRYEGYLVFPFSIIPDRADMIGPSTVYYFNYGCAVTNPYIPIFDVLDFSR